MVIKSLRTEIAILAITSILIASCLVLWLSVKAYETLYQESASNDLNGLSENLSIDLLMSVVDGDDFEISNTLLQLDQYQNVRFAAVYDEKGTLMYPHIGKALTEGLTAEEIMALPAIDFDEYFQYPIGVTTGKSAIVAKKYIGDKSLPVGYILVSNDLSTPLLNSKKNLVKTVLPWVVITILATGMIIFLFQNRALAPLIQLANFTRKIIKTKDYSLVAKVGGKQEIAHLTDGLNSMMKDINAEVEKNKEQNTLLLSQQAQMEKMANYDALTDLPNRQFFEKTLAKANEQAKTSGDNLALMFFDIDGFKLVNDSFGHKIGDRLLCRIADKAAHILTDKHVLARLGGAEFLVLFEKTITEKQIIEIAEQFIDMISAPIEIDSWNVNVGTNIGIAMSKDAEYDTSKLIANADIAMYSAKKDGRNRHKIFEHSMLEESRRKHDIANTITHALNTNEFTLFYQPKVNMQGVTVGYEALARWSNEALGFISPAEFIPIAEQSGSITSITEWVIERVCKDTQALTAGRPNIKIALNLSVHDLNNEGLLPCISGNMQKYQVKAQNIEFEITESAYLDHFDKANYCIEQIKQMGSTIALDDFGTGYSSLGYLTQINIDTLKLDKQFIDEIGVSERSTLVTKTIIDMAIQLNLQVCAEGIETVEQSHLLIENGCHLMQGYYFGRPQPLETIISDLSASTSKD
jgi:diguanylate cyclase (GGDEF)-like protein